MQVITLLKSCSRKNTINDQFHSMLRNHVPRNKRQHALRSYTKKKSFTFFNTNMLFRFYRPFRSAASASTVSPWSNRKRSTFYPEGGFLTLNLSVFALISVHSFLVFCTVTRVAKCRAALWTKSAYPTPLTLRSTGENMLALISGK
jgi:hypothetical protein